jgi:hypothetical protein
MKIEWSILGIGGLPRHDLVTMTWRSGSKRPFADFPGSHGAGGGAVQSL